MINNYVNDIININKIYIIIIIIINILNNIIIIVNKN